MKVIQCDKCNSVFQESMGEVYSEMKITFLINGNLKNTAFLDLCPACTQKLKNELNGKA